jgi:hypothetical protein
MAAKKTSRKKTTGKTTAKRAASAKATAKKTASSAARKQTRVVKGARTVGKVIGVLGYLVDAGAKAAADVAGKAENAGRESLGKPRKRVRRAKSGARKKG